MGEVSKAMSWVEDSVVFRGAIRRSGNSLVITIPAELSQRFLLREGQEFVIYGVGRKQLEFEGGLQVYLGYFVVHEKVPAVRFEVEAGDGGILDQVLREVEAAYAPSQVRYKQIDERVELEFLFGAITERGIKRPRSREEIDEVASAIEFKLRSKGVKVLKRELSEKIVEWRTVDPASLSKAPYKLAEVVRWSWEI